MHVRARREAAAGLTQACCYCSALQLCRSYFGCCDSDYDDAPSVVGYCTLEGRQIYTPPIVDGQVGKVLGLW